eukprot:365253-Chlamydomonas_euryale.AAC.35
MAVGEIRACPPANPKTACSYFDDVRHAGAADAQDGEFTGRVLCGPTGRSSPWHLRNLCLPSLADVRVDTFGKQDPYVVVRVGRQTYKTKVQHNGGINPVFNETFVFNMTSANDELKIVLREYDMLSADGEATWMASSWQCAYQAAARV